MKKVTKENRDSKESKVIKESKETLDCKALKEFLDQKVLKEAKVRQGQKVMLELLEDKEKR